jgi:hypothetical protein
MFRNPLERVIFRNKALDHFCFAIGPQNIDTPARSGIFPRHESRPLLGHLSSNHGGRVQAGYPATIKLTSYLRSDSSRYDSSGPSQAVHSSCFIFGVPQCVSLRSVLNNRSPLVCGEMTQSAHIALGIGREGVSYNTRQARGRD